MMSASTLDIVCVSKCAGLARVVQTPPCSLRSAAAVMGLSHDCHVTHMYAHLRCSHTCLCGDGGGDLLKFRAS